jgi:SAM-dependent methyltransferase
MEIRVFEIATADNFFPRGYLLANPDLMKVFSSNEADAKSHFDQHGRSERRRQLTPGYVEWSENAERKIERFRKFAGCFKSLPAGIRQFPVAFGNQFESLANYGSESAGGTAGPFREEMLAHPDRRYADVGAGLRDFVFENCLYVEIYPSVTTDVMIEPNSKLPFRTASLDGIGCFAVLEHVREPWAMAAEFARVVKPGGKLFIDWPFLQPTHGYPSHYYNATRNGLRALFESNFDVELLTTYAHQGPNYTVQWILSWLLNEIGDPELRARFANKSIGEIAVERPQSEFWRELLKSMNDEGIEKLSCGNFLIATRNGTPAHRRRSVADLKTLLRNNPWWRGLFG